MVDNLNEEQKRRAMEAATGARNAVNAASATPPTPTPSPAQVGATLNNNQVAGGQRIGGANSGQLPAQHGPYQGTPNANQPTLTQEVGNRAGTYSTAPVQPPASEAVRQQAMQAAAGQRFPTPIDSSRTATTPAAATQPPPTPTHESATAAPPPAATAPPAASTDKPSREDRLAANTQTAKAQSATTPSANVPAVAKDQQQTQAPPQQPDPQRG